MTDTPAELAQISRNLVTACKRWRHIFSLSAAPHAVLTPHASLAAYFKANELTGVQLAAEQACLQASFMRSTSRRDGVLTPDARAQERREREREELAQRLMAHARAREAREQARFDAEYQARARQQRERAAAERELERQASKDAAWRPYHRVTKKALETAKQKIARECGYVHETFALTAPTTSRRDGVLTPMSCAELGRSDLDLLSELEVPIVGGLGNAHARRRAFFSRIPSSSRPVSLAHARRAA